MPFHVPSPPGRGHGPGRVCRGEEPRLRSRPPRGEDTIPGGSVTVRGRRSGHVLSGEEPRLGSRPRSRPVRGGVMAQVTSCHRRGHSSGHILSGGVTAQVMSCQGRGHGSGHVLSGC